MSRATTSLEIPRRISLAATVAASVRKAIHSGSWGEFLPTERRLGEMLQVSRPTLRVALHLLATEGLLEIRPGQGTRLLKHPARRSVAQNRRVAVIAHQPLYELGVTYQGINEMRAHLTHQGFDTEVVLCQSRGVGAQRYVENYLSRNRVFCCVLLSVSEQLQSWFAKRSVPALVLGSCHPNVRLPSLDFDNRSVCRHAVGVFASRGHRRVALLVPDTGLAGDLASERGFSEGIEERKRLSREDCRIVRHDGTAAGMARKLDGLLRGASAATALMMANVDEVFIVMMHLLKRGISIPDQVSIVSRDHNRVFEIVNPPIAHYKTEADVFEHRLSRLMLQMVAQGYLPPEPNLIVPTFFEGGTIKSLT